MRKRNSRHEGDAEARFSASLSSGQLVIAISVSLFVMLTCFLVGVLVGKYDNSLDRPAPVAAPLDSEADATESGQTSPHPLTQARRPESARSAPLPPPEPRVVDLEPLPAERPAPAPGLTAPGGPGSQAPSSLLEPMRTDATEGARTEESFAGPPSPLPAQGIPDTPPRSDAPRLVLDPIPAPEEDTPIPVPATTPAPEVVPMAEVVLLEPAPHREPPAAPDSVTIQLSPAAGAYGVQVVSLTGGDRARRAREVQSTLREKHGLESTVLIQENGTRYTVVVTGFGNREAATAARDRLRRESPFKDCFVRGL